MVRLGDLRLDQRSGRVEARSRTPDADLAGQAVLGGDMARLAEGHQQAAGLDEPLQLQDALEAHAAGDVLRRPVIAEEAVALGLGVGARAAARLDVEDEPLRGPALVGHQDDVVVRP